MGLEGLSCWDSETGDSDGTQDILTCGSCQKTFALSDIVRFIQHKVLQCNKENYGQCYTQAGGTDRDSDTDGRRLMLTSTSSTTSSITTRRASMPNVSCRVKQITTANATPLSTSTAFDRVHTPPPTSPAELLRDGASSTPKQIGDEPENASTHCPSRGASPLGCTHHDNHKPSVRVADIKQERMDIDPSSCGEDEFVGRKPSQTTHRNGSHDGRLKGGSDAPEPNNTSSASLALLLATGWDNDAKTDIARKAHRKDSKFRSQSVEPSKSVIHLRTTLRRG
uniref:BCL-11A-like CCHC zinc finger domain-containing protein n=1 Tax=Anopheles stephensi TaxID=30069 RepID=A0A182Y6K0_ANOST